jgi:transposase
MLVGDAGSVGRMKGANYLSARTGLTAKRGMSPAAVAGAHSMLVTIYYKVVLDPVA